MDQKKSVGLPLVGASPDAHLLGVLDQVLTELGMRDGDDLVRTLPGVQALEVDHAVLGDQVLQTATLIELGRPTCIKASIAALIVLPV